MHIYVCPYCSPCEAARLVQTKSNDRDCDHKKDKQCEAEDRKCKEVMKMQKNARPEFVMSKKFLKDQKRKIKDG